MVGRAIAVVVCRDGVLPSGAVDAFTAAGGHGVVVGTGAWSAALQLPAEVVQVAESSLRCGQLTAALAAVSSIISAHMVILPASPDGRDLAPSLAAVLGRPLVPGATRIRHCENGIAEVVAVRSGGLVDHVHRVTVASVVTLLPAAGQRPSSSAPASARLELLELAQAVPSGIDSVAIEAVRSIAVLPPDPETMDLTEARCIVAGGNGLVDNPSSGRDRFDKLRDVGARIGASLGGTRVASDAGWIPFERQIGTTGVEVSPRVYLAFGISGATQHTSGLGSPDHIISVNTDPSCPMMAMAEVAIVADAYTVVESLLRLLSTQPEGPEAVVTL
jgi:electron transfer flavoprotein alpha subunit